MTLPTLIAIAVLLLLAGLAVWSILKRRRSGRCAGCPYAAGCAERFSREGESCGEKPQR